ncbi:MAG: MotA/TolQ/ExbB proton channel family protein [Kiritimatiellae bacterium]|nr:MotA/TolQ/ExbB proton channel family protein [Kiritimatiellia bacterium]
MKTWIRWVSVATLAVIAMTWVARAQQPAAGQPAAQPAAAQPAPGTTTLTPEAQAAEAKAKGGEGMGFWSVVTGSGWLGAVLWLALGLCSVAAAALIIDSFITIKEKKIAPADLVNDVREAMSQGDVMKAIKHCESRPTPLASILTAGFQNVQEGFDVIQDIVGVAADLESEKLLQRVAYLNVCANLAPMLGLLGTVQGMIYAFMTLAMQEAGAAQTALLAKNIGQALWTTAAGLMIAIPSVGFYTFFRNTATKIILGMEGLTLDLIKTLRNVEVVAEEE